MGSHAHDDKDAAASRNASRRAEQPDRHDDMAPDQLLALQRTVGNAAVAWLIQRQRAVQTASDDTGSSVRDVLRGPGRPLDPASRADMESRLGADFSDVHVHTGPTAQRSAAELGARAYTSGNHVVIGENGADKHTLAHELVHVVQQRQGPVAGTDTGTGLSVSHPHDHFEREAEAVATRALSGPAPTRDVPDVQRRTAGTTNAVQRAFTDANGAVMDIDQFKNQGGLAAFLAQYPAGDHEFIENVILTYSELDDQTPWSDMPNILATDHDIHPGATQAVQAPAAAAAPAAPQYTAISTASEAAFLESITSIWAIAQGNTGAGLKDSKLWLSTSAANEPSFFTEIWDEIEAIRNNQAVPTWFPTTYEACPSYKGQTANHAECRIMHKWGKGNCAGGIIRTTQAACIDCANCMHHWGVLHDNAAGRRYGNTGWIHPFTGQPYGPQITGNPHYDPTTDA